MKKTPLCLQLQWNVVYTTSVLSQKGDTDRYYAIHSVVICNSKLIKSLSLPLSLSIYLSTVSILSFIYITNLPKWSGCYWPLTATIVAKLMFVQLTVVTLLTDVHSNIQMLVDGIVVED